MDNEINENMPIDADLLDALNDNIICTAVGTQMVDLCVPVTVRPSAIAGQTMVRCCGAPVITPGTDVCPDTPITMCGFTINQKICIEVPVQFGADADTGDAHIACHPATMNPEGCRLCDQLMADEAAEAEVEADPEVDPEA